MTLDTLINLGTSWLLTYAIHSTILILAVWLVVRGIPPLARRIGPRGENLAWKFALVGGLVSASVQVGAGIHPAFGALEVGAPEPVAQQAQPAQPIAGVTRRMHPIGRMHADVDTLMLIGHDEFIMVGGVSPTLGMNPMGTVAAPRMAAMVEPGPAPTWPKVLFGLAVLGSLLALIRLGLCVRTLRRRLADRSEVLVDPALEQFLTLCRDAQIDRRIRLTHTVKLGSPIALARSEIVLPTRALDELSPLALRSVLAHELAHLERRDPAWLLFAAMIEALCFFQPLNRLARRGMQESAELLCDDWAIAQTGDGVQFAKSLAELAGWSHRMQPSSLVAGMISGERPLVRRVRRALDGDPHRLEEEGPRPARLLFGLGALGALVLLAPGAVDASPPEAEAGEGTRMERRVEKRVESRIERAAEKASERAERARAKAEKAREDAREAEREAREAELAAERLRGDDRVRGSAGPSVVIRDGDDFLIIDEKGMRAGAGPDRIEIDETRIRILHGDQEFDFDLGDLDFESFGAFDELEILKGMEDLATPGMPSGHPGVFDPEELEHSLGKLDELGAALEREIEREIRIEDLDHIDLEQLEGLMELGELEELMELGEVMQWLDEGEALPCPPAPMAPPAPPAPPRPI